MKTDCCLPDAVDEPPRKMRCPQNGREYAGVPLRTLMHHLTRSALRNIPAQGYYFCDSPDCDVVYFGEDQSMYTREQLRETVGQKRTDDDRPLCYCFDLNYKDVRQSESVSEIKSRIKQWTRQKLCQCDIRNPSGKCCLRDFPQEQKKNPGGGQTK